jgi:PAS domain S-box-containing protein
MVSTKFRGFLSILLERASVYRELAESTFARLQESAREKLAQVRQRSGNDRRKLRAITRDSLIAANEIFAHLGSATSRAAKKAAVQLEKAREAAAGFGRASVAKAQQLWHESENDRRKLRAIARDSLIIASETFARLRLRVSSASRKTAVQLEKAQEAAAGLGRASADKAQKLRSQSENDLRKLAAGCRDAIFAAGERIVQLGREVLGLSRKATRKLRTAQDAVIGMGRSIADKPRRMRELRLTRENDLRTLLASSPDAIVVTDNERRLVIANAKALELFGISEFNMANFTIDAFLASVVPPDLDWNDSSSEGREVRTNRCKIRRLDGGWRVAECQFVTGIVPRRHLYKFSNAAPYKITPPKSAKGSGSAASLQAGESPSSSIPSATVATKKIPRHGVGPAF